MLIFVRCRRLFHRPDAGQMLLKTQIRFAGEPVGVRTECLEKTGYFLLDFLFPYSFRNP